MSERLILIDSSAWIGFLSAESKSRFDAIEKLLLAHRIAINPVIRLELLTGAKDDSQYRELRDSFNGLHMLELIEPVWELADELRYRMRKKGALIPVPDLLIACTALAYGCELMHQDRHFDAIARSTPLKILRVTEP
jgi:predicted nucleic acid-binding protein